MEKQIHQASMRFRKFISVSFLLLPLGTFFSLTPLKAQSLDDPKVPQDRQIHNTFVDDQKKGLGATNPIKFLNQLRQASSLDNATAPSDAIDQALKAFDDGEVGGGTSSIPTSTGKEF